MQPKYQSIASELKIHIQAGKYSASNMLPTEHVLMDEYSVSRQTIRQALSILEKEGLIEKRRGSGSHIKHIQRQNRTSQHRTIAVVTTYISNYIFPSILREVENVLSSNNCMTLLFATQNQVSIERKILQRLLDSDIDGIIVEGTKTALPNPNLDLYERMIAKNIPLVFINGYYPELQDCVYVIDDNSAGGKALVNYLYDKGHRKIAGIFKSDDMQGHRRYAGYSQALMEVGLDIDDSLVFWYNTDLKNALLNEAVFSPTIQKWKEIGCTSIVCYNDEVACFIISLLTKQNIHVPEDISVVSFDNSHLCELGSTPITSLSHEASNVGSEAAQKLLSLLDENHTTSEKLSWVIVERISG